MSCSAFKMNTHTQSGCTIRRRLPLLLLICYHFIWAHYHGGVQAEIATATDIETNGNAEMGGSSGGAAALLNNVESSNRCPAQRRFNEIASSIEDVEDLELDVPVNTAFDNRQKKRFQLHLNASTPLTITFSQNVVRKIYYNQTTNLSRVLKSDQRTVLLACALRGQYDLFVQAKHRGSVKIEAHAAHPQATWPLLNRTNRVSIRSQNRVRKRQMIVKWDKSKFDFHAVHYCLVVNTKHSHKHFCSAVNEFYTRTSTRKTASCFPGSVMDYIWLKPPERVKKIDPRATNVICVGSRTQLKLRGLAPNHTYFLDVFGVHTKRQNLTFHIASTLAHFKRAHPLVLHLNALKIEKISGLHGVQVFSFKINSTATLGDNSQRALAPATPQLRYLILPCGGSEVDVKILKQRKVIGSVTEIYRPTYIKLPVVHEGDRYIIRFTPSNEDEKLRANKVGLAVTTSRVFNHLPELPENITVFEVRSRCKWATIAWYSSPEIRTMSYCILVFSLPQRNRGSIDYTNYCMDFGRNITEHPLFYWRTCIKKVKSPPALESQTILNLIPGETYLIYVTANLSEGKPLPYQSLKVQMGQQCPNELFDSRELTAYY